MNRAARRAAAKAVRSNARRPNAAAEAICLARGHRYPDEWVLRPAWVGAGISLELVHFDRTCGRCGHTERVWREVQGDRAPLGEAMTLTAWLQRHGATVAPPPGAVRVPDQAEIDAIVARVAQPT